MAKAETNCCPVCGGEYAIRKPPGSRQHALHGTVACVGADGLYLHEAPESGR